MTEPVKVETVPARATTAATAIIVIDSTPIVERLQSMSDGIATEIDAALPADLCGTDPVLAERRRCAFAALSKIAPHYMAEGTVISVVRKIIEGAKHGEEHDY